MSGKFMKVTKIVLSTLTLAVMASQLMGCSATNQDQLLNMHNHSAEVEIEVSEPDFETTESAKLEWVELGDSTTYPEFRGKFDEAFSVKVSSGVKSGVLYTNEQGKADSNITLSMALKNDGFVTKLRDTKTAKTLFDAVEKTYADLEDSDRNAAVINAYFNLLPDEKLGYFSGDSSLSRDAAMTLLTRAMTPVENDGEPICSQSFIDKVGNNKDNPYIAFASKSDKFSYLSSINGGLTNKNFTNKMTRAEYIYMTVNAVYGTEEIDKVDTSVSMSKLSDVKVMTNETGTNLDKLTQAVKTPNEGVPKQIAQALVLAYDAGAVDSETRWEDAVTKTEAIDIFVDLSIAYGEEYGYAIDMDGEKVKPVDRETVNKLYESVKDDITIDAEKFYTEFKTIRKDNNKLTDKEIVDKLVEANRKPEETTTTTTTTETTTTTTTTTAAPVVQTQPSNGGGNGNSGNNGNGGGYVPPVQTQPVVTDPPYVPPVTEPPYVPPVTEPPYTPPVVTPPSGGGSSGGLWDDGGYEFGTADPFAPDSPGHLNWQD